MCTYICIYREVRKIVLLLGGAVCSYVSCVMAQGECKRIFKSDQIIYILLSLILWIIQIQLEKRGTIEKQTWTRGIWLCANVFCIGSCCIGELRMENCGLLEMATPARPPQRRCQAGRDQATRIMWVIWCNLIWNIITGWWFGTLFFHILGIIE